MPCSRQYCIAPSAEQAVDVRVPRQKLCSLFVAGLLAELCHSHPFRVQGQPGGFQGRFKAGPPLLARTLVQQGHADVARGPAALRQHVGRGSLRGPRVVVVHRAAAGEVLA